MRPVLAPPIALVLLFLLGGHHVTHDPVRIAVFFVSLFGAWLLQFAVMAMIGTLAMFLESAISLFDLWLGLFAVLSGYMVPLELYPGWVRALATALPFRY